MLDILNENADIESGYNRSLFAFLNYFPND